MFLSTAEKNDFRAFEAFEALELDTSDSGVYFKEKCAEFSKETLLKLRDKRIGFEGNTLLHNAARCGSLPAVLYLIRLGHDVEPINSNLTKTTPLMYAIQFQQIEIAVVLVEAGAKLNTHDVNGENALPYAGRTGSSRMIKWIIKASNLGKEQIQEICSTTNIKLRFPEDVASNTIAREVLIGFRENGHYHSPIKKKRSVKGK